MQEEPEVSSYSNSYNCGICGDRVFGQHECWAFHKIQTQEHFSDDPSGKYADATGSEDVIATRQREPQYPTYS